MHLLLNCDRVLFACYRLLFAFTCLAREQLHVYRQLLLTINKCDYDVLIDLLRYFMLSFHADK